MCEFHAVINLFLFFNRKSQKHVLSKTVDLRLGKSIDHLRLMKGLVRKDGPVPDEQHIRGLKEFTRKTIKRFSHTKEKEELRQYVYDHPVVGSTFGLGMPILILELISRGLRNSPDNCNQISYQESRKKK
jgi:hypothetical protein